MAQSRFNIKINPVQHKTFVVKQFTEAVKPLTGNEVFGVECGFCKSVFPNARVYFPKEACSFITL
jgi:molybdopterin/thiamine biosynthesis adenylyltransferase